ncbi:MAG: hypothetical protein R2911_46310 [Caldilineaceae bacterium]
MKNFPAKQSQPDWLWRRSLWGAPNGGWLLLILITICALFTVYGVFGVMQFTATATVVNKWREESFGKDGSMANVRYYVRLYYDDPALTCEVATAPLAIWNRLTERGYYTFTVTQTLLRCVVNDAVE